jgi:hypothetical protein
MSVPEANPGAAQPRAILNTADGLVSFWFNLTADRWEFHDSETAILGDTAYPKSFGHRPIQILVKSQANIPESDVVDALIEEGAVTVSNEGNGWYTAKGVVFKEESLAARSLKNHANILKYAQVNSVVEWIANRQMAFYFTYKP